jgi:hypothetical protein
VGSLRIGARLVVVLTLPLVAVIAVAAVATAGPASAATRAQARATATRACRVWHQGDSMDAADASAWYRRGARIARIARRERPRIWGLLARDMTFVAGLPETGNTAADIAKAGRYLRYIKTTCGTLGVHGILT